MSGPGTVYLLRHGDTRTYKIGRTRSSADSRKRTGLATGNPEILTVVQSWTCDVRHGDFETLLHNTFNAARIYGRESTEFFDFGDRDEAAVVADIGELHRRFVVASRVVACAQDLVQADDDVVPVDDDLKALIGEHRRLQAEIKLRQFWCSVVDAKLKARIGTHAGIQGESATHPVTTWRTQLTTRLDQKAFKDAHPDLHTSFCTQTASRVFRVS